jgi:hypothetical protein
VTLSFNNSAAVAEELGIDFLGLIWMGNEILGDPFLKCLSLTVEI